MSFEGLEDPKPQARLEAAKMPEELLEIAKECGMGGPDGGFPGQGFSGRGDPMQGAGRGER